MALWTSRSSSSSAPRSVLEELDALLDHLDKATELIALSSDFQAAVGPAEIIASIAQRTGVPNDIARKVFNALENLRNLSEEFGTPIRTLDEIALTLPEKISSRLIAKKNEIADLVNSYSSDNGVRLSYKAQRLTYLRENIYQEAEVITDARPVFDSAGDSVVEYLITHSLVATYFRQGRLENIHLVMDAADVLKLRKALDRAIIKARALSSDLGDRARILRDDDAAS
jgi:hypothetical protein